MANQDLEVVYENTPGMAPLRPTPPPENGRQKMAPLRPQQPAAETQGSPMPPIDARKVVSELPPENHDVSNPYQNLRDIVKHCIIAENYLITPSPDTNPLMQARKHCVLVDMHLIDPKRRCPDCICKHLLAIDAYLDEVLTTLPSLIQVSPFSDSIASRVFDAWRSGEDPISVAISVKAIRNVLEEISSAVEENKINPCVDYPSCVFRHLDAIEGYAEEISTLDEKRKLEPEVEVIVPRVRGLRESLKNGVGTVAIAQSLRNLRKGIQPLVVNSNGSN